LFVTVVQKLAAVVTSARATMSYFQSARSVVSSICRPIRSEIRARQGGDVNVVTFRRVGRAAAVACASGALFFGLAGASVAAPAVAPAKHTPAANTVQITDHDLFQKCHQQDVTSDEADL
jgi:hypothetical protein